ncbi:hypothetical protein [Legionella maioricensis]|uniref:Uncharacterized protein n=1 Tax=Legionella maioricensis TaxID=2896528 RepID=A0A9X2IBX8_9GAMM|nr:hypothetical protein [Legionella maioricensis]MCL9684875.1 hypothetical protein [Legionella maioricensis]MCL9688951.1 hypothetical protein [Legionella maioricensis]
MTFKEWCFTKYGIMEMSEGKILSQKFLPLTNNPFLIHFHSFLITSYGGIPVRKEGQLNGYILPEYACRHFARYLQMNYQLFLHNEEYKVQAPFNFKISPSKKQEFLQHFGNYFPFVEEFEQLKGEYRIKLPPYILDVLYRNYYRQNKVIINVTNLKSKLNTLKLIRERIIENGLSHSLDKAHILSLDYSNSKAVGCTIHQASSAYAMSLHLFAELHKEGLSSQDYLALKHVTEILASYDQNGNLQQGLKSDSIFIHYLLHKLTPPRPIKADGSLSTIAELPDRLTIRKTINQNTYDLLHGRIYKSLRMRRFLPDVIMRSETNEIILQTGGMINHSAMARIIKVGMLKNGTRALPGMTPHYFNYFKVETDLGAGCHDPEWTYQTCTGTYITQLHPTTTEKNGQIRSSWVNRVTHPLAYQRSMENTLTELIKTERELCFYRQPQEGPNEEGMSPVNSAEADEWRRLHARKILLSGTSILHPITFQSVAFDGKEVTCVIQNQKGYMQEGGSCPIFSIKQLVTSVIGSELTSLHSQFLQTHNGAQHLQIIEGKINEINHCIRSTIVHDVNNYLHYMEVHQRVLQSPTFCSTPVSPLPLLIPENLIDNLSDFPDLYGLCIVSTGIFIHRCAAMMSYTVKNGVESTTLFNYFSKLYNSIPAEFKAHYKADYEKIKRMHERHIALDKIIEPGTHSHQEHNILWCALENKEEKLSPSVIKDLKIIRKFYNDKLTEADNNRCGNAYKSSLHQFYKKAVDIRLADLSPPEQVKLIMNTASDVFKNRHNTPRLITDVKWMTGALFGGLGLIIGIERKMNGHTFWSHEPTVRNSEFTMLSQSHSKSNTLLS